jgi:hypothetical protein
MRRSFLMLFIIAALTCYGMGTARAQDSPEKAAQESAEKWMPLWDAGQWEESYKELAEQTRKDNTPRQWYVYWYGVRKPLGKVKSRKLVEAKYIKSLPGEPGREGAVLRYESSFENKELLDETFAVTREGDGTWRVAYYITP